MNTPLEIDVEKAEKELEQLAREHQPRNKPWSQHESELVRKYYRRVPLMKLARMLDRTSDSVQNYACCLRSRGLKLECDK